MRPRFASLAVPSFVLAAGAMAAAQVPAGPEFLVNGATTSSQAHPSVAMKASGDFVVAWGGETGLGRDVFGRQFSAAGVPQGGDFRVNTYTTGFQGYPDVAVKRRGEFVIVWESGQTISSATSIRGRHFDAAARPVGGEFAVNSATTYYRRSGASVDAFPNGAFVTAWGSGPADVAARRFDSAGDPIGPEFVVSANLVTLPSDVATDARGNFVVVWEAIGDGWATAIFGQRYDGAGAPVGSAFQVNTYTTGFQSGPSISGSPGGGFVVAWSSGAGDGSGWSVFARRFDASGAPAGPDFVVNTYTTGDQGYQFGYPSVGVAADAIGNFVVTWSGPGTGGNGMFGQRYLSSGAPRGGEFNISLSFNRQAHAAIASDPVGNFVAAWTDEGISFDLDVHARRYGGLVPAALEVDSGGNHVLEPGETVDVRPWWRNTNGVAQTFSGALGNMAGPPPGSYTITDASGTYGTVASGAAAQCIDCYAVFAGAGPTRPDHHWDATVIESILPDAQGQQKEWVLHIGATFTDVPPSSGFYRFVETLLHNGVTSGCAFLAYCPSASVTRAEMAVFALVAREGVGYVPPACGATPMFADVPASSPFCRWIEELARRGVVGGCGGGNYCPSSAVTREQMAVFVLRTLDPALSPPACLTPLYNDVPAASVFCPWIEELTRRNVVTGCGGGNYCPGAAVTRAQMAVFISVTFGLTLYGP